MQRATSIEDQVRRCTEAVRLAGGAVAPDLVFSDAAMSGQVSARDDFGRMCRMMALPGRPIEVVVTESQDRFNRDGELALNFFNLAHDNGVRLICVSDGIDSATGTGAKLMFGIKAVMSEIYVDYLRDQTRRGLNGQAERGMSTGGHLFGYMAVPVQGAKGKSGGAEIRIDEEQAEIVRRIFRLYRDGGSYVTIARTLTQEGIDTPRERTQAKAKRGWVDSTVRAMLRNEAYIGRWTYGAREWIKVKGAKAKRVPRMRTPDKFTTYDRPHLRIIDQELWEQVQQRMANIAEKYAPKTERKGKSTAPGRPGKYPLSGLLYCWECGAPMVIVGSERAKYYQCGDHHKRGTCPNDKSVREDNLLRAVLGHMVSVLRDPSSAKHLEARAAEATRWATAELATRQRDARQVLRRAENMVARARSALLAMAHSPEVVKDLSGALDVALQDKARAEATLALALADYGPAPVPTATDLSELATLLEKRAAEDPMLFRETLRRMTADGRIVLRPQSDGSYLAQSFFFPLVVPPPVDGRKGPKATKPRRDSSEASDDCTTLGCAGWIGGQYTHGFKMDARVPRPVDLRKNPSLWKRRPRERHGGEGRGGAAEGPPGWWGMAA